MQLSVSEVLLVLFVSLACYFDIRFKRVYNWLTLTCLVTGIVLGAWEHGMKGFYTSIEGAVTGLMLLVFPYMWGWVGGGDVKFLAAAGSLTGPLMIVEATAWGLILFGAAALVYLSVLRRLQYFLWSLWLTIFFRDPGALRTMEVSGSLPLALFLGLGTLSSWIWGSSWVIKGIGQ